MKTKDSGRTLESYKIFPYIAWALVIGFATFVYNITMALQEVTKDLERQSNFTQEQIDTAQKDFDNADLDKKAPTEAE